MERFDWYKVDDIERVDSPALLLYPDRIRHNIQLAKSMIGDVKRLRPHVKTNKCKEAVRLMMDAGVDKFKCATIAEAEMLAMVGAGDVLLAYQPSLARLQRLLLLVRDYPDTIFSCLVDDGNVAEMISQSCMAAGIELGVYIDLNVGMNRTGIASVDGAVELYSLCEDLGGLRVVGLHAYDGHLRQADIGERKRACDEGFERVLRVRDGVMAMGLNEPVIVVGGSPTFPIHSKREGVECSPGTFIYWDWGYSIGLAEQGFLPAAVLVMRVISLPVDGMVCLDLGHKSVASENELSKRIYFLGVDGLRVVSQSEEHLVVDAGMGHGFTVGDVLYGLPYHVCPTVALYERSYVVEGGVIVGEWEHVARDRVIGR